MNTAGTRGGPGGRDRILAVKSRKNIQKSVFFKIFFCIYLCYTKYWGKQNHFSKDLPFKNAFEFIKENSSKYKGNFEFFLFPFFGMKITFLITLKLGAEKLRS